MKLTFLRFLGPVLFLLISVILKEEVSFVAAGNAFSGSVLSVTPTQSCATIFDSKGNSQMQCDQATVLQLSLDDAVNGGVATFLFQNTQNNPSTKQGCDQNNPGTCIGGAPFYIVVNVTKMVMAYNLNTKALDIPFGYMYGSCLTRKPSSATNSNGNTADASEMAASCGVTQTYTTGDYTMCQDTTIFPPGSPGLLSKCAFMCGLDLESVGSCSSSANMINIQQQYVTVGPLPAGQTQHLGCPHISFATNQDQCFPDIAVPYSTCACGGSYSEDAGANGGPPVGPYANIVVCRNGACAGSCGTALNLDPAKVCPDEGKNQSLCGCPDGPIAGCNVQDPDSICLNTARPHRCLKCNPEVSDSSNVKTSGDSYGAGICAYYDISVHLRCMVSYTKSKTTYEYNDIGISDYCGNGRDAYGGQYDPSHPGNPYLNAKDTRTCNCDANFVEKVYPVTPFCSPYEIINPPALHYTVEVYFTDLQGTKYEGSTMTIGSGWTANNTFPPSTTLPLSQYTPDGFALSRIISVDSSIGKTSRTLNGQIVMCNQGSSDYNPCDQTYGNSGSTTGSINQAFVANAYINTSTADGRHNPWGPEDFESGEAKVPLAYQVYRYANRMAQNGNPLAPATIVQDNFHSTYWYYTSEIDSRKYGAGCGQIGWFPQGLNDMASAETMCAGNQGTCVPGIDTLTYGEVVETPCYVEADFIDYVASHGGAYPSTTAKQQQTATVGGGFKCYDPTNGNQNVIPKHVPSDWNTILPQYWVHGGILFADADPTTEYTSIRMTISVAADFQKEVISEGPGLLTNPQECQLMADTGLGTILVGIENTGTQINSYVLNANCTTGIYPANSNGVDVTVPPGYGGPDSGFRIPLIINSNAVFRDPNNALVPSCTVDLYPLIGGKFISSPLDSTNPPIKCTVEIGIPDIYGPYGDYGSFMNAIGNFIPQFVTSNNCKAYEPWCYYIGFVFGGEPLFTANQLLFIMIFMVVLIMLILLTAISAQAYFMQKQLSFQQGMMHQINWLATKSKQAISNYHTMKLRNATGPKK